MKTSPFRYAVPVCVISLATLCLAAPSLPVSKPPVMAGSGDSGPAVDPASLRGQWFYDPEFEFGEFRTHEFHDNAFGFGGGVAGSGAIAGQVVNIQWAGPPGASPIVGFDVLATITNDLPGEGPWLAGTNRHGEALAWTNVFSGILWKVLLTADFALAELTNRPPQGFPYEGSYPAIYATNENLWAWYCWAPQGPSPQGGYFVPAWDFGVIFPGASVSRLLCFAVEDPGLQPGDPRFTVIYDSYSRGLDIFLNRSTSLKISTHVDTVAQDPGGPYPANPPFRSSDVSVFHAAYDFGDAPAPYPTLFAHDGARHWVNPAIRLGNLIDGEGDGRPTLLADGDNNTGLNDEDGVAFVSPVARGGTATINVTASVAGYLSAWLDFNADGDWDDANEQIFSDAILAAGVNTLVFTVPADAALTNTYARFRFSSTEGDTGLSYVGAAWDGEVEDYLVTIVEALEEEPEDCAKWLQPCDCQIGLDLQSWGFGQGPGDWMPIYTIADDWLCDGRPITSIRWWGSYLGWMSQNPETNVPPPRALGQPTPVGFILTWYTDIPAGPGNPFSRPGAVVRREFYPLQMDPYATNAPPGVVLERPYCVSQLHFIEPGLFEHEFVYDLELPATNVWNEKEGQVYWLSVQAYYLGLPATEYLWGWKTTAPQFNWNDDAVVIHSDQTNELLYPPQVPPWDTVTNHPYTGQSVNMAFELRTDVCPRRAKKWVQPADMTTGLNMPSYLIQMQPGFYPLRADDFRSDGRRITDVHWWGSYLGYMTNYPGPVEPPPKTQQPLGFLLSWHTDVPTNEFQSYSMPGELLTNVFVPMSDCHEVYYGTVTQFWHTPPVFEHEFQYYVDLLNVAAPWYETNGVVYWLNIQAVFPPTFEPGGGTGPFGHTGWGWKTTPLTNRWNDASVEYSPIGGWVPAAYPAGHPYAGEACDLAFELTTDEVGSGSNWWNQVIRIDSIRRQDTTTAVKVLGSVGDAGAGVQVLQFSTNLLGTNWLDLWTNPLPLPAPYTNIWIDIPSAETVKFYRVKQR